MTFVIFVFLRNASATLRTPNVAAAAMIYSQPPALELFKP